MPKKPKKRTFQELLLQAIDESLGSLGESVKHAIYFHLEKKFRIAKHDIPDHLEAFNGGLQKIFGIGAKYIEILIMKRLYETVGQPLNLHGDEEFAFVDYVNASKESFCAKHQKGGLC